ncbi:glycosyltransferase family 39 protein [Streptomyces sp. NPDC001858]
MTPPTGSTGTRPRPHVVTRPPMPPRVARRRGPGPGLGRAVTAAVPAGLVLVLGLWGITRQDSMWRDEAATWQVTHRSLPEIWRMLGNVDVVHGLYYTVMHLLFEVFGDSLLTLRAPSVLAMAAAAALTADLGARLAGGWSGLGAGLAVALLPMNQAFAQEGRPYAMVTATVAYATWLLVAAMRRPRALTWVGYAVAVLLGALLNWFSLLALPAHAVTVAVARPHRAVRAGWLLAAVAAVLGALPLILASRSQSRQLSWIQPASPGTLAIVTATVLTATACALLRAARRPAPTHPAPAGRLSLAVVALPLCVLPTVMLLVVSLTVQPVYVGRYVLFAQLGLALLLGVAATELIGRLSYRLRLRPAVALTAVTALAFLAMLPVEQDIRAADSRVDDVLSAADVVAAVRGPADAVVFIPSARRDTATVTPDAFHGLRDIALVDTPADAGTLHGVEADPAAIARALLREDRVILVSDAAQRPAGNARDRAKQRVLREHFIERSTTVTRGRSVTVYERIR